MSIEPNQQQAKRQPEDGTREELNLTNNDATLSNQSPTQPDAPTISDSESAIGSNNLTQSVMNRSEINPEYGDAADPTFETL